MTQPTARDGKGRKELSGKNVGEASPLYGETTGKVGSTPIDSRHLEVDCVPCPCCDKDMKPPQVAGGPWGCDCDCEFETKIKCLTHRKVIQDD